MDSVVAFFGAVVVVVGDSTVWSLLGGVDGGVRVVTVGATLIFFPLSSTAAERSSPLFSCGVVPLPFRCSLEAFIPFRYIGTGWSWPGSDISVLPASWYGILGEVKNQMWFLVFICSEP